MRSSLVRLLRPLALSALAAAALITFPTQAVRAEFCAATDPMGVAAARGYMFIGTLSARQDAQFSGFTFDVHRVFAGGGEPPQGYFDAQLLAGKSIKLYTEGCDSPRFERRQRYLVSTAELTRLSTFWTAVWRVDGDRVQLIQTFPETGLMDARLFRPQTVAQAVALMTTGTLPATDALAAASSGQIGPVVWLAALGAFGLAVLVVYRIEVRGRRSSDQMRRH